MDERRSARVSVAVKEELIELIGFELDDPRLLGVDVTQVTVSPDARHAQVKVSVRGDEKECRQALKALDNARNYLRHELSVRLQLRRVPELEFAADPFADAESRVDLLLKRVKKSRAKAEKTS